jgi:hypothetical protein
MTHDEWKVKKDQVDKVYAKAFDFFENKKIDWDNHGQTIKIFPFWDQVYITDDGAITQLPRGTTEEDYQELFKQLGMTSLEFRETIRTQWELHRQHYEWRRKDPNCEEYYEDMYSDLEGEESVNS